MTVPDDLDAADIIHRTASNERITSATGRWGERVSIGVTRALAADLSRRLPNVAIENRRSYEPSRRLLVDVEHFEIGEDGRCTLTARWRMTTADGKVVADSRRATFSDAAPSNTDAAVAQAMTAAIDQLATEMAVTVRASLGSGAR